LWVSGQRGFELRSGALAHSAGLRPIGQYSKV
jgi:hypothetical protein